MRAATVACWVGDMDDLVRHISHGHDARLSALAADLVATIAAEQPGWDAAVKWGQLTFAEDQDFHHWLCGVKVTKKAVVLTFHFGGMFDDPGSRLIAGSSRYLRRLEYTNPSDIDGAGLAGFLAQAAGLLPTFRAEQAR